MSWTYDEAEAHVLELEQFGMRFGVERMRALLTELGSPQDAFDAIHVVGSNGKSSTVWLADEILRRSGRSSGAYVSPHLKGYYERVRVGGDNSDPAVLASAIERVVAASGRVERDRDEDDLVTQFETLTAAAFLMFAEAGVEFGVVEAGLGGRYDATNVLDRSRVQVLTGISLEHTRLLGDTLAEIAAEKADVVNAGSVLIVGDDLPDAAVAVAESVCAERGARLKVVGPDTRPMRLAGDYQHRNFALAAAAVRELVGAIDEQVLNAAATSVEIPGRFEVRDPGDGGATVVLDGAHNPAGMKALVALVKASYPDVRRIAAISILHDKDIDAMLTLAATAFEQLVITQCSNPRVEPSDSVAARAHELGIAHVVKRDPDTALTVARELAGSGGLAVATGSLYLLADLGRGSATSRVSGL
jgi:dihydrofolate synthase/folylpolyglutamate synthase